MIGKLQGIVDLIGDDFLILNVNGVGYLVFVTSKTLSSINIGDTLELLIETHVREDHIHLYGFLSWEEKSWFNLITSVQGIGNKTGLLILSKISINDLSLAIASEDKTLFTTISGIGPKLAQRIIVELKGKHIKNSFVLGENLEGYKENKEDINSKNSKTENKTKQIIDDATSALVNLGYKKFQAFEAVSKAYKESENKENLNMQILIKDALKHLSNLAK